MRTLAELLAHDRAPAGTPGIVGTGVGKEAGARAIRRGDRRETECARGEVRPGALPGLLCKGHASERLRGRGTGAGRLGRALGPRGSRPATSEPLCFCSTAVLRTGCRQGGVIPSAHASEDDAGVVL